MSNFYSIILFIISFFSSWCLLKTSIPIFKRNWSIVPNYRSSHKVSTPFGGGLIFSLIIILTSLIFHEFSNLIFLPLVITGHIDDCKGLSAIKRLYIQFGTALLLILYQSDSLLLNSLSFQSLDFLNKTFLVFILVFLFTTIVNIFNFFDGIDGLLASNLFIIFLTVFIKLNNSNYIICILGSLLGFVVWNWSPAKIFMGDSGSYFLGAIFFNFVFNSESIYEFIQLIFLGTPIFADIIITLIRRFSIGENIFKPHKLNLYQRLNQSGMSHSKITLIYSLATFLICFSYLVGSGLFFLSSLMSVLIIGYFIDKKASTPFLQSLTNQKMN